MASANEWTLFHNPRCSKSRDALAYLKEKGVQPTILEYLKTPLDAAALNDLLGKLHLRPRDLLRANEDEYDALGLGDENLSREALIEAIVQHPILLQRPIILRGEKGVIGRPTEAIDCLLGG